MQNFSSSSAPLVSPLPGVIRADGITFIRASGEDAVKFLHGQLSQAVEGLGERTTLAGYCSPKGRLLAIVRVWMDGPDVMLALPASMAEGFLKRLRMYVLRAKVRLEPVSPMPATLLFAGEAGRAAAAGLGLALPMRAPSSARTAGRSSASRPRARSRGSARAARARSPSRPKGLTRPRSTPPRTPGAPPR